MSGKNKSDEFDRAAWGNTDYFPCSELWDDIGGLGESELPRTESWLANLQVIEVVGVGAGVVALVSSLLPLFYW